MGFEGSEGSKVSKVSKRSKRSKGSEDSKGSEGGSEWLTARRGKVSWGQAGNKHGLLLWGKLPTIGSAFLKHRALEGIDNSTDHGANDGSTWAADFSELNPSATHLSPTLSTSSGSLLSQH